VSLLWRLIGLGLGGFLVVGGLASLVLGVLALGNDPVKGVQVTLFSLVMTGVGGWVLWENLRKKRPAAAAGGSDLSGH